VYNVYNVSILYMIAPPVSLRLPCLLSHLLVAEGPCHIAEREREREGGREGGRERE
jgi:hypothetical protein